MASGLEVSSGSPPTDTAPAAPVVAPTVMIGRTLVKYWVVGPPDAPSLVLCHGMALSHRDLLPLAQALSDRWRVLLWDMPGHGSSLPGPERYDLTAMTDALELVLEAAGAQRPVLLGFSFGGMVAQEWLRRHPGGASALIAYACFAPFSQKPLVPRWMAGPLINLLYGPRSWRAIRDSFARQCAVTGPARAQAHEASAPLGKPGFMAISRALLDAFRPDPTFRIDCPLLILRGAADANAAGLAKAERALSRLRPDAEHVLIPDAGHCAHLDRPAATMGAVASFLDRLDAAVGGGGAGICRPR